MCYVLVWIGATSNWYFTISTTMAGEIALGGWGLGEIANVWTIEGTVIASGCVMMVLPLVAILLPLGELSIDQIKPVALNDDPEIALLITLRS